MVVTSPPLKVAWRVGATTFHSVRETSPTTPWISRWNYHENSPWVIPPHQMTDQSGRMHFYWRCSKIYSGFQIHLGRDLTYQTAEVQISSVCPSRRVRYQVAWRCMEWSFSSFAWDLQFMQAQPWLFSHVSKNVENTWKYVTYSSKLKDGSFVFLTGIRMLYKRHNHPAWWPYKKKCPRDLTIGHHDHDESLAPFQKHIRSVLDGLPSGYLT